MKQVINFIITVCVVQVFLSGCNSHQEKKMLPNYYQVTGNAQGTTYKVIYNDSLQRDLSVDIDSILTYFDGELSIYVDTSTISLVNKLSADDSMDITEKTLFIECFNKAQSIYNSTQGNFNPALYPLVKYWGFLNFEKAEEQHQQEKIDSLLQIIDFSKESLKIEQKANRFYIIKKNNVTIDFNAIAQGFSVDVIAHYLERIGIQNYMVEVGGELRTLGLNNKGEIWKIGIDKPVENALPGEEFQKIIRLKDKALATSGNYRKFYKKDGVRYSHTINPATGKPVTHQLLSTTVIASDCATADAYATAFMVMGTERTKRYLSKNPSLDIGVMLIYNDEKSNYQTWSNTKFSNF